MWTWIYVDSSGSNAHMWTRLKSNAPYKWDKSRTRALVRSWLSATNVRFFYVRNLMGYAYLWQLGHNIRDTSLLMLVWHIIIFEILRGWPNSKFFVRSVRQCGILNSILYYIYTGMYIRYELNKVFPFKNVYYDYALERIITENNK